MRLIYENERGKVVMHGGGGDGFNIIEVRGLSFPDSDVDSVYYPNVAGCSVEGVTHMERTITVSGDVYDKTNNKIVRAMKVFSKDGIITISSGGKTRKISARCISFEPNKRKGMYTPFTAQFVADNPYFTDMYETCVNINKREAKLSSPFVPPFTASTRKTEADIVNQGDSSIEPVFLISSFNGAVCPKGIIIKNLQNGNEIKLVTDIKAGEIITVDIKNCKITSNQRGNIISCIDNETSISRFSVDIGISTVKITAEDIDGAITADCRFNNKYIYAVI